MENFQKLNRSLSAVTHFFYQTGYKVTTLEISFSQIHIFF